MLKTYNELIETEKDKIILLINDIKNHYLLFIVVTIYSDISTSNFSSILVISM